MLMHERGPESVDGHRAPDGLHVRHHRSLCHERSGIKTLISMQLTPTTHCQLAEVTSRR